MRVRMAVVVAALASLVPDARGHAATAVCPTECRREIADIMCLQVITVSGDRTTVTNYYWSDGAD